jgi:DNA mismatch repair protein MutS
VVARAKAVLARLEKQERGPLMLDDLPLFAATAPPPAPEPGPLEEALASIDPDALSPREALEALYRLKRLSG